MKTIRNTLLVCAALFFMLLGEAPPESRVGLQLIPDAHAVLGVWRRHARRWAVVGTAAVATTATAAAYGEEQAATTQQQAAATQPSAAASPSTASTGKPLPLGTVVSALPSGCTTKAVSGVQYYHCGANDYRAVFQGNNLVYVTAKP